MTDTAQRVTEWEPLVRDLNKQIAAKDRTIEELRRMLDDSVESMTPPTDSTWIKFKAWLREPGKRSPHAISAVNRFEAYISRQKMSEGD